MTYCIGLDLGGTNIKGLGLTESGRVLAEEISATGSVGGRNWIGNVERVLNDLQERMGSPASCVGLAAPGLAAPDNRSIAFMPERLPGLENLNWQKRFRLSSKVPVLNDAHAALLGEVWRGAARRCRNVVLLTLGTGVGGAAIVDGNLLRGHIGRAGHFGHISLNPDGELDITGTPGSLEDAIGDSTVAARTEGRFHSTRELVVAVRRRDALARKVWLSSVRSLAAGVTSLINALDPEVVILAGGITLAGAALFEPLSRFLDKFEWRPGGSRARIVQAKLGDRAGAFGAAWQAMQSNLPKL
ncbi:MAG TPA: ROK family protein [Patescibacteria group bacterium]|jgi:glucokinase|nr:ROK family protein [Patescibacteria group bacterium]